MKVVKYSLGLALLVALVGAWWSIGLANNPARFSEQEAGFEELNLSENEDTILPWQRPDGPLKVALQAGHWKNSEVPEELDGLKQNGGGAVGGGTDEATVVLNIAQITAEKLRALGLEVEILPTTVPPGYYADAFISIHADGNLDSTVTGFKAASPRRDYSGKSLELENIMYKEYENVTGFNRDPNVTSRMRGYYAFNWRRYEHAIHPMTPAVILETGFLTSRHDQKILIHQPEIAADGIVNAVIKFLELQ